MDCCNGGCIAGSLKRLSERALEFGLNAESPTLLAPSEIGATSTGAAMSSSEPTVITICVLCHGVLFGPGDAVDEWATWISFLEKEFPDWIVKPLLSLRERAKFVIGAELEELAALAADEMLEIIRPIAAAQTGNFRLRLHCISHSMGGLCLRGALPRFFEKACNVDPGIFLTLSTPHLGVQASWGAPQDMWRNYTWALAKALRFSAQVPQFSAKDSTGTDADGHKIPYLVSLADPAGQYLPYLGRFQARMCVTMASGDIVIPVTSGSIWDDAGSPPVADACKNTDGESICAGWGFKSFSRHEPSPPRSAPLTSCEDARWVESNDRQCLYLPQVLEGLQTLDWDRLVVKTSLPKGPMAHVFLTGKKKDQFALEHCFSRRCIAQLIEMLRTIDAGGRIHVEAPCWQETIVHPRPCASVLNSCSGRWAIATEEGCDNYKHYPFENEMQAKYCFDTWFCAKILFNPDAVEEGHSGPNKMAYRSIRRAFFPASEESFVETKSWIVGAEHGIRNAKFYPFETEEQARTFFSKGFLFHARILFDPDGNEVQRAGVNYLAHRFVLQEFQKR